VAIVIPADVFFSRRIDSMADVRNILAARQNQQPRANSPRQNNRRDSRSSSRSQERSASQRDRRQNNKGKRKVQNQRRNDVRRGSFEFVKKSYADAQPKDTYKDSK